MKKLIILFVIFTSLFIFSTQAFADSPITESDFSRVYQDISIVKEASKLGKINSNISSYLSNSKNPIDVKAAVINALSWDGDGNNADAYSKAIYKVPVSQLTTANLSGDQLFCIGYLLAMDDYFEVTSALDLLKQAEKKITDSFTVSVTRAVVEAQWGSDNKWSYFEPVLRNSNLKRDMRQDAVNIILDYAALYEESGDIILSQSDFFVENGKSQKVYLYGTYFDGDTAPYEMVKQSDKAYTAILRDQFGIFYLDITGLKNGSSSLQIKNENDKSKTINFTVVSSETSKKLEKQISMYVGSTKVLKGKSWTALSATYAPYLKSDTAYIPLDFMTSAVGGKLIYDKKSATYTITYSGRTISFKPGSNVLTVNGKTTKISANIETKNQILFMPAKDFAAVTGKNYTYYNGLIIFADSKTITDIKTEDYVLNEISDLLSGGKSILNYPVLFQQNGKYGYKDSSGKVVIQPAFDDAWYFSEGMAAVAVSDEQGNMKYGFIDLKGKYIIEPKYDWANSFVYGMAPVFIEDNAQYIDKTGKAVINAKYGWAGRFSGGLAPVMEYGGNKWGYIDITGKLVIPYKYDEAMSFSEGMAAVKKDDKWGYIDKKGRMVIQSFFNEAGQFHGGVAEVTFRDYPITMTITGKVIVSADNGDIYVGDLDSEDGLLDGNGVYTWADGDQYIGEFSQGIQNGYGIYTSSIGHIKKGIWKNGALEGKGELIWANGDQYEGEFSHGAYNGQGKYTFIDGTVLEGIWKDDQFVGN